MRDVVIPEFVVNLLNKLKEEVKNNKGANPKWYIFRKERQLSETSIYKYNLKIAAKGWTRKDNHS